MKKNIVSIGLLAILVFTMYMGRESQKGSHPLSGIKTLQEGFSSTSQYYYIDYDNDTVSVSFSMTQIEYAGQNLTEMNKITKKGIDYYYKEQESSWEGRDENGKFIGGETYEKMFIWESDGNYYSVLGSSPQPIENSVINDILTIDYVSSIDLCDFERIDFNKDGFRKTYQEYSSVYTNEEGIQLGIKITDIEMDKSRINGILSNPDNLFEQTIHNDRTYYELISSNLDAKLIYCLTDHELYQFVAGYAYPKENEVDKSKLNFLDIDYIEELFETIS